jgi:hypothetical protein
MEVRNNRGRLAGEQIQQASGLLPECIEGLRRFQIAEVLADEHRIAT